MAPTRLIAGLALVAGGAVGFYATAAPGTPAAPAVESPSATKEARTSSEDPGTYTAPESESLDGKLVQASDVGTGWLPTGYEPAATPVCPLQAIPALGTVTARAHAGFEKVGGTAVVGTVLTRYSDDSGPSLVVDEVVAVSEPSGDGSVMRGCASSEGSDGGTVSWSDDQGIWSASSRRAGDGADMSMTSRGTDGTELYYELRWRRVGDLLVSVRAVAVDSPPGEIADRMVDTAVTRAR